MMLAACSGEPALVPPPSEGSLSVDGDLVVNDGTVYLKRDRTSDVAPELHWIGMNGSWLTGIDVANNGGNKDFVLAAKRDWPVANAVNDLIYLAHNDDGAPTVGIGVTPPSSEFRLQISGQDAEPAMGVLALRRGPLQTGHLISVFDQSGSPRWWLDADYWLQGENPATEASLSLKADTLRGRPLVLGKADGSTMYGFQYAADSSGDLYVRYLLTGVNNLVLTTTGRPVFPNGLTTDSLRLGPPAPPSSASAPCARGDIAYDSEFIYLCVADDTWKRSSLSSW